MKCHAETTGRIPEMGRVVKINGKNFKNMLKYWRFYIKLLKNYNRENFRRIFFYDFCR
jgi:hypothetical protein